MAAAILGLPPHQWFAHHLAAHALYEQRPDREYLYELLAALTHP
jgi:hypothetical protein